MADGTSPGGNGSAVSARPFGIADDEVSVLDLLIAVARRKRAIFAATLAAAAVSVLVAFLLPKYYAARVVLMPPQQDQSSASAMLGQLLGGGLPGGGSGIAAALGLKNPNDLYVGILKSRTIADRLISRFKLQDIYDEDTLVETREALDRNTRVTADKDGLIRIEVEDQDRKRAADIANAYAEELENLTAQLAISDASRRRVYFRKQLEETRKQLANADLALKAVQEETGLIKPDQAGAIFEATAALRGQISAKEIELASMRSFASDGNPSYIRAQQELASMRKQLAGLEMDNRLGGGNILVPTGKVPQAGMQFLEKWRDVKYYETVYELLAKQLELAKIDEGKNATIIQVVDKAVEPDKKSKPKRTLIVALSTLLAALLAVIGAVAAEAYSRLKDEQPSRLALLRRVASWR